MSKRNNGVSEMFGNWSELIFGLALTIGLLLPHSSIRLQLINPILCVLFFLQKRGKFDRTGLLPIAVVFISMIINMIGAVSGKSMLTALSIVMCILVFPMVNNVKVKDSYLFICFSIIFLSQIAYVIHLDPIISIVDAIWPISWGEGFINHTIENVDISNYEEFRLGGLYRNPNHLAKYVSFILAIYLVNNNNKRIWGQLFFSALCFFSIMLTGSRTGVVVGSLLVIFGLFRNQSSSKTIRIVVALGVVFYLLYSIASGSGGRGMTIGEGLQGSAGPKMRMLIDYLSHESRPVYLLFGHLDPSQFQPSYYVTHSFDCEYGYLIYCFGFVGLIAFLAYLFRLYKSVKKSDRFFFFILLWMISSSIFFAYRAVFVFMLLLSTIYQKNPRSVV